MTTPSNGSSISWSQIQTEFGGANPISLSEYYAGAGLVPGGTAGQNGAIASSGTISAFMFFGASAMIHSGLWTFGYNDHGQLGIGTSGTVTNKSSPVRVGTLTNWAQVAAGGTHTAAVKTDGSLWTCGYNNYGQLGDGTITWRSSPVQVGSLTNWAQVAGGYWHTAALR